MDEVGTRVGVAGSGKLCVIWVIGGDAEEGLCGLVEGDSLIPSGLEMGGDTYAAGVNREVVDRFFAGIFEGCFF